MRPVEAAVSRPPRTRRMYLARWLAAAVPLAVTLALRPAGASSQDVEMLGERYGTRPPPAYFDAVERDPLAFRFSRGRPARMRARMRALAAAGADPSIQRILGPRDGPVEGTMNVPVVLGLFQDSPSTPPYPVDEIDAAYFTGPGLTITAYYDEVSRGKVTLGADLHGWIRSGKTRAEATGGVSGLQSGTVGPYIVSLLEQLDGVDWGEYDNDGPDGLPNSGDDDGYVDVLAVLHPTDGAECGGSDQDNRIWSHRWSLRQASGSTFTTATPAAGGGFIRVDDYTVQPTVACWVDELNEIGVFTHELGHAFGLPDLYDTVAQDGTHGGIGRWGLMGSGSEGCDGDTPEMPCHLSAWSKAVLGWVDVVTLSPGTDHGTLTVPPVETTGTVYRVNAMDGSGEYFLLENRQRLGFDARLFAEGLLVWHIDPLTVQTNWAFNDINGHSRRGVWLRQADGLDELGEPGGGRGDRYDPFPLVSGSDENRVFHAGSNPASRSHGGTATGVTVTEIARSGDDISLALTTRLSTVSLGSQGDSGGGGLLTVDGRLLETASQDFEWAPFDEHVVEAAAGEPLSEGRRRGFDAWTDDASAPRVRSFVTPLADVSLVAAYGPLELELAVEVTGGVDGIAPGRVVSQPASGDLWFEEGTEVELEAVALTGFGFLGWTGALAGQPNPARVTMTEPVTAGAAFQLTYAVTTTQVTLSAATAPALALGVENATPPVFWTLAGGALPDGLTLSPLGEIEGAAMEVGSFSVTVRAQDARGLTGEATVDFVVTEPELGVDRLASPFLTVGPALDSHQRAFLDRRGNGDGGYDLGDFRAWVLAHPDLPLSAALQALVAEPRTLFVPLRPVEPDAPRSGRGGGS